MYEVIDVALLLAVVVTELGSRIYCWHVNRQTARLREQARAQRAEMEADLRAAFRRLMDDT